MYYSHASQTIQTIPPRLLIRKPQEDVQQMQTVSGWTVSSCAPHPAAAPAPSIVMLITTLVLVTRISVLVAAAFAIQISQLLDPALL